MVDKSMCKCKKKMCLWKGNSGFEKEKFVLLSQKKWKIGKEKEQKERSMKKESSNKTRSTNNENWDEFGGRFMFLEREFCERVTMMKCFNYLKIFEFLYPILSINQTLNPWPHYKL